MLTSYTLFSGSGGNSFYIGIDGHGILIDCGGSARGICRALQSIGTSLDRIDDIFITHEHCDHVSALRVLVKNCGARVHIDAKCAENFIDRATAAMLGDRLMLSDRDVDFTSGRLKITSFRTPHDAANPRGYVIDTPDGRVGYATDTGCVTQEMTENLLCCRYAVIEANHDLTMLKYGPYPKSLKARIASDTGHLSNDDSARLAFDLYKSGTERIILAHLSRENNTPQIAKRTVASAFSAGDMPYVEAASPVEVTRLI